MIITTSYYSSNAFMVDHSPGELDCCIPQKSKYDSYIYISYSCINYSITQDSSHLIFRSLLMLYDLCKLYTTFEF